MRIVNSIVLAFAMYSKIPVPKADWKEENMRYVMCAFPLVGAVIGAVTVGILWLSRQFPMGHGIRTVLFVVLPLLLTGGIHLDGFMDTSDALGSWQNQEKRMEILKDSHVGAMAVTSALILCILNWGIWWELSEKMIQVASIGYFLSRVCSGFAVATFPCAKNSGLAATFQINADQKKTRLILGLEFIFAMGAAVWVQPIFAAAMLMALCVSFGWYYGMSKRKFGGITGDLAGWFLQISECMLAGFILLAGSLLG